MAVMKKKLISSSVNHCIYGNNNKKGISFIIITSLCCFCMITTIIFLYYDRSLSPPNHDNSNVENKNHNNDTSKVLLSNVMSTMIDKLSNTIISQHNNNMTTITTKETTSMHKTNNNININNFKEDIDEMKRIHNSNNKTKLPHLVIHVGPPKTATTTIQQLLSLYHHHHILYDLDKYLYMGSYLWDNANDKKLYHQQYKNSTEHILSGIIKSRKCHTAMNSMRKSYERQHDEIHQSDQQNDTIKYSYKGLRYYILSSLPCAQEIVNTIQIYSTNDTNLLISDETLSIHYKHFYGMPNETTILDWTSLYAILYPYYQITVIATYRRFYDWLPSAKQQAERWTLAKPRMNTWPIFHNDNVEQVEMNTNNTDNNNIRQLLRKKKLYNGKIIEPILPYWWKNTFPPGKSTDMPYYYTDSIINGIQQVNDHYNNRYVLSSSSSNNPYNTNNTNIINLVIMNMHDNVNMDYNSTNNNETSILSIRSQFFCQALPDTINLCQYSKQLDYQEEIDKKHLQQQLQQTREEQKRLKVEEEEHSVMHQNNNSATNDKNNTMVDINDNNITTPLLAVTKVMRANPRQTTSYDELVVGAAKYHLIDTVKYPKERHFIGIIAKEYHETLLKLFSSSSSQVEKEMIDQDDDNDDNNDDNNNDEEDADEVDIDNDDKPNNGKRVRMLLEDVHVSNHSIQNRSRIMLEKEQQQQFYIRGFVVRYDDVNNTDNNYEFTFICPSDHELSEYLNQSLLYEEIIVPQFNEKKKHISDFWYHAHIKQEYCTIDINTILNQHRHWKYFFNHIIPLFLKLKQQKKEKKKNNIVQSNKIHNEK